MDTLYLRENENQGHMKKKRFFGTPLIYTMMSLFEYLKDLNTGIFLLLSL